MNGSMNGNWVRNENNPYVRDIFHFKNHSDLDNIFTNPTLFIWNYSLSGFSGAFFNLILVFFICFKTPKYLKPYARMLMLCCCADGFYLFFHGICHVRLKINDGCVIFVVDGIAKHLPYKLQAVAICCLCGGMTTCCTVLPAQYFYRYCLLAKNITLPLKQTFLLGAISFSSSSFMVVLAIPCYMYSGLIRPGFDYGTLWYPENPVPRILFADTRSYLAFIYLAYAIVLCTISYGLAIFLYWDTMNKMNRHKSEFGLSEKTMRLQKQFNRVLMIQAIIPLFTNVLPIVVGCASTFTRIDTGHLGAFIIIILSWLPVLNSVATLLLLAPYRNLLIRFLTTGTLTLERKVNVSVITANDTIKHYAPWAQYNDQRHVIEDSFMGGNFQTSRMD